MPILSIPPKQSDPTHVFPSPDNPKTGVKFATVELYRFLCAHTNSPLEVTSGYRTRKHNVAVGGAENSAHLRGWALDIACADDHQRLMIIKAALQFGVRRIGLYQHHVHVDLDNSLPGNVMWIGGVIRWEGT